MGGYVKNTMLEGLVALVAPHHCYGCGKLGATVCSSCRYNIVSEPYSGCIECGKLTLYGVCGHCEDAYDMAWCVGERDDVLKQLIDGYKFSHQKASYRIAAELLDATVPLLPSNTIVVPVPTVPSHIRQRGYDHTALIAKEFARLRGLRCQSLLSRAHSLRQRGATRKQRIAQAAKAFTVAQIREPDVPVLLLDDIVTTGATIRYAAKTVKQAGAKQIMVALLARQPLK